MSLASDARAIAWAAIRSVDPARAVRRSLRRSGARITIGSRSLPVGPRAPVQLVGLGKAAGGMVDAAAKIVGTGARGIVFTPRSYPGPRADFPVVFGEHPVPGPGSFAAGRKLLEHVRGFGPDDPVLFLLSGGGSATAEVPAPPVRGADLVRATHLLLSSGAPIGAANAIRRHLSAIKGGRLANACPSLRFATIAISDVVGDAPADIASGPTAVDPSTFRDALRAVRSYRLTPRMPPRVLERLRAGALGKYDETVKPGDRRVSRAPFVIAATNRGALRAASWEARRRGYRTRTVARPIVGETRPAAERFARDLLSAAREASRSRPVALLGGGETTVTLGPRSGRGGRNGEFALATARALDGWNAGILSVGTDGIDGPTDAAGGWADGTSRGRAVRLGLDLERALASHSTYDALDELGDLFKTGPTGTNVSDIHVGLASPVASTRPVRSAVRRPRPPGRPFDARLRPRREEA